MLIKMRAAPVVHSEEEPPFAIAELSQTGSGDYFVEFIDINDTTWVVINNGARLSQSAFESFDPLPDNVRKIIAVCVDHFNFGGHFPVHDAPVSDLVFLDFIAKDRKRLEDIFALDEYLSLRED